MAGAGKARLEPTWHIAEGECRDSLALEVAASCRLPEQIIQRAADLYEVRLRVSTQALPASRAPLVQPLQPYRLGKRHWGNGRSDQAQRHAIHSADAFSTGSVLTSDPGQSMNPDW